MLRHVDLIHIVVVHSDTKNTRLIELITADGANKCDIRPTVRFRTLHTYMLPLLLVFGGQGYKMRIKQTAILIILRVRRLRVRLGSKLGGRS